MKNSIIKILPTSTYVYINLPITINTFFNNKILFILTYIIGNTRKNNNSNNYEINLKRKIILLIYGYNFYFIITIYNF